ncbi:hypothetical protein D3C80_1862560 [compost metagenome]
MHSGQHIGNGLFLDVFGSYFGDAAGAFAVLHGIVSCIDLDFLQFGGIFLQCNVDGFTAVYGDDGCFKTNVRDH